MSSKWQYILSKSQKEKIAQNLIEFLEKDISLIDEARIFVSNWILTTSDEKRKAFFDVWDIVLNNYLPKTRPVLFRSSSRRSKNGKIASFSGRLECVRRFSKGKGVLIICDTKETLAYNFELGHYICTFYPIVDLLNKAKSLGGCGFSEQIFDEYIGEDEYIMRIDFNNMLILKWC